MNAMNDDTAYFATTLIFLCLAKLDRFYHPALGLSAGVGPRRRGITLAGSHNAARLLS
jgi:hypothetical protein